MYDYNLSFSLRIKNDTIKEKVSTVKRRVKQLQKLRKKLLKQ